MYFDKFPTTIYSFDGKNATLITDFMRRVAIPKAVKENLALYEKYDIQDGDTPEIVADKIYRNPQLHWIILLVNEIIDPRYDWCMSQEDLNTFVASKYGDVYGVHHYEDEYGYTVDSDYLGAYPVSNFEYEDRKNEERRSIRILSPQFVTAFIQQFEKEIAK